MITTSITNACVYILPLLLAAAAMMLFPAPLTAQGRASASIVMLAVLLLSGSVTLIISINGTTILRGDAVLVTLAMLAASLTSAPLLDRARPLGLMIAAPLAGLAVVSGSFSAPALTAATLHTMLIAATMIGLCGSLALPLHPSRHTAEGALRCQPVPRGIMLAGWFGFALVLGVLAYSLAPTAPVLSIMITALVGALVSLLTARPEDALAQTGQGLVAGTVIAILAPLSLATAALLGVVAAFCVARSAAITTALRLDDPHHFTGTLLMPAMLGLLMPGLLDVHLLAPQIVLLTLSLAFGGALAAIIWPLTMLFFGVALPPRLVRGGLGH